MWLLVVDDDVQMGSQQGDSSWASLCKAMHETRSPQPKRFQV